MAENLPNESAKGLASLPSARAAQRAKLSVRGRGILLALAFSLIVWAMLATAGWRLLPQGG